jgi:hypothetical protein
MFSYFVSSSSIFLYLSVYDQSVNSFDVVASETFRPDFECIIVH